MSSDTSFEEIDAAGTDMWQQAQVALHYEEKVNCNNFEGSPHPTNPLTTIDPYRGSQTDCMWVEYAFALDEVRLRLRAYSQHLHI